MALGPTPLYRALDFAALAVVLIALCMGLGVLAAMTADAAGETEGPVREYLIRLAWLAVALLGLAVVMLGWLTVRYVNFRLRRRGRAKPTRYINFWALAGERFKLPPEQEPDQEDKADSSDDPAT